MGEKELPVFTHFFQVCKNDTLGQAIIHFTEERSRVIVSDLSDIQVGNPELVGIVFHCSHSVFLK